MADELLGAKTVLSLVQVVKITATFNKMEE